jgi:hypothetical protein
MTTFYFKVSVEVEDDLGMATECYDEDYFQYTEDIEDENGNIVARFLDPEVKSQIIMGFCQTGIRLGVDESMGTAIGNYTIGYERIEG